MTPFAVIKDNLVVNTILADSLDIAQECNPGFDCVEYKEGELVSVGDTYDGSVFTKPITE